MEKYEILEEIETNILKVENKNSGEKCVIKKIKIKEEDRKKIENEGIILSKFNSKYIVKYIESFYNNNYFYLVMEYCGEKDLAKFIDEYKMQNKSIDKNILYQIICDICSGLKEIHDKNIIHRDLKPNNIFINEDYNIKIGDFGISKHLGNKKNTKTARIGTVQYMAPELLKPELIKNDEGYNYKIDIWALGCILYELFKLKPCFDCDNYFGIINLILNHTPEKIDDTDWQNLIEQLLNKDYEKRPDINTVCELVNKFKDKYLENTTSYTSSNSLCSILQNHAIFIKFKYNGMEEYLILDLNNTIKDMLSQLKLKTKWFDNYEADEISVLYNSLLLNNNNNINKTLKAVHLNNNSIIRILTCRDFLG
jgi:NIMA (never in mitosis gene a)-related kinase